MRSKRKQKLQKLARNEQNVNNYYYAYQICTINTAIMIKRMYLIYLNKYKVI